MAIDLKVSDGLIDLGQMGVMFVTMAQGLAAQEGASQRAKDNWDAIYNWLELDGGEIGQEEQGLIEKAWKAYMAIGVAPSKKLQSSFDQFSKDYKLEDYDFQPDKPPAEVITAFDRMLATDDEIKEKRAERRSQTTPKSQKMLPAKNTKSWVRKTLIVWGILSLLWVMGLVMVVGWYGITHDRDTPLQILLPIFLLLLLVFPIGWLIKTYIPNQLSTYTKKTIAIALIWIMGGGIWAWFFGDDLFYGMDELVQFILFPPIVIIIAAMLWRWATRNPTENES